MSNDESVGNIIQKVYQDKISDLLLKNSNLTRIQFETFVIDLLTETMSDKKLSFKEKTYFRRNKVSRGSFSRTLGQARRRIISSIYTIVLLSYIGVFDSQPFDDYQVLAEKLREYYNSIEKLDTTQNKQQLKRLENELLDGIINLAKPTSLRIM